MTAALPGSNEGHVFLKRLDECVVRIDDEVPAHVDQRQPALDLRRCLSRLARQRARGEVADGGQRLAARSTARPATTLKLVYRSR